MQILGMSGKAGKRECTHEVCFGLLFPARVFLRVRSTAGKRARLTVYIDIPLCPSRAYLWINSFGNAMGIFQLYPPLGLGPELLEPEPVPERWEALSRPSRSQTALPEHLNGALPTQVGWVRSNGNLKPYLKNIRIKNKSLRTTFHSKILEQMMMHG
jgi:hypothetical protein